ncbi:UNVERIFIED_CONTAM: hypothetical protein FKN15_019140 [Acipenser sinensis]
MSATPVFPPVKRKRNASQSRRPGLPIAVPIPPQLQALDLPASSDPPRQHTPSSTRHLQDLYYAGHEGPSTADSILDMNARLGSLEARSSPAPPPVHTTSSSVFEVIDPTPSFTLSSSAPVDPQQSFGSRRITVSPALRKQIIEGKDINLVLVLIATYELIDQQSAAVMYQCHSNILIHVCLKTMGEFMLAFSAYRDMLCSAFPHRREELDHYLAYIIELAVHYGGTMFYQYHKSFSAKAAPVLGTENAVVNWAKPDIDVFHRIFGGLRAYACGVCVSSHATHLCPKAAAAGTAIHHGFLEPLPASVGL